MGFSPRKRAASQVPHIRSWPEVDGEPRVQGFVGYKAGMTHVLMVDPRKYSTTAGQEIHVPVTVLETPPIKVAAIRVYEKEAYGLKCLGELWAKKLDKELARHHPVPKKVREKEFWKRVGEGDVADVRVIVYTQPYKISGVPKKKPDVIELRVGGGNVEDRLEFAKSKLGAEIKVKEFASVGKLVDVIAVTKGKGFQGHVKRWGVKLLHHKNRKHRRMIGTLGPWYPNYVRPTVPQAGQTGYHQRTEYNKQVLIVGEKGEEITPKGGFLHYGVIRTHYVALKGSVPGPAKRLVVMRDPVRAREVPTEVNISYISLESKQGV